MISSFCCKIIWEDPYAFAVGFLKVSSPMHICFCPYHVYYWGCGITFLVDSDGRNGANWKCLSIKDLLPVITIEDCTRATSLQIKIVDPSSGSSVICFTPSSAVFVNPLWFELEDELKLKFLARNARIPLQIRNTYFLSRA